MKKSRKEYFKEYYLKNKERIEEKQKEYILKNKEKIKERALKYHSKPEIRKRIKEYQKEYYSRPGTKEERREYRFKNKEWRRELQKEWYLKNKEYVKEYCLKNKEHIQQWKRNYHSRPEVKKHENKCLRERRRNDPIFRMKVNMRSAMSNALSGRRKSNSTMKIIGCSVEGLFQHLDSCKSWEPWMTRENYGKWDVDHIIAIANWDINCPLQFALCWDKSNLQPLEHIENIKKGAR